MRGAELSSLGLTRACVCVCECMDEAPSSQQNLSPRPRWDYNLRSSDTALPMES